MASNVQVCSDSEMSTVDLVGWFCGVGHGGSYCMDSLNSCRQIVTGWAFAGQVRIKLILREGEGGVGGVLNEEARALFVYPTRGEEVCVWKRLA